MSQTVIALYDDFTTARRVVEDLVDAGFSRNNISIVANDASGEYSRYLADHDMDEDDVSAGEGAGFGAVVGALVGLGAALIPGIGPVLAAGPFAAAAMAGLGAAAGAATGGIVAGLVDLGVPEEEANYYAEGIRRGGTMVSITTDESSVNRAQDIMNRHNPIDLEGRATSWRESGWTGYSERAAPYTVDAISSERDRWRTMDVGEQEHIDVVEEQLQVGKREIEGGGVRVRKYMTAQPVEEQIRLREEHVRVERRPVDRPASESDFDTFREGVIEVTEHREEPIVSKTARVVEEVLVDKDVTERTETVRDTVRRTDVEVEQMSGEARSTMGTGMRNFESYEPGWRTHYNANFSSSGTYEQFAPAYRYGYNLATNDRYRHGDWTTIEPEARHYWEERNPGTWDRFKNAVRQAWMDVKDTFD